MADSRKRPSLAERRRQTFWAMELMRTGDRHPEVAALFQGVRPRRERKPRQPSTKPSVPLEHDEQSALISWWFLYCNQIKLNYRLLVANVNGQILMGSAKNPQAVMAYLRQEGFRDGMLDLTLYGPRGRYHGLVVEMKRTTGGVVSDDQKLMSRILGEQGYMTIVCYGAEDAKRVIMDYLRADNAES